MILVKFYTLKIEQRLLEQLIKLKTSNSLLSFNIEENNVKLTDFNVSTYYDDFTESKKL